MTEANMEALTSKERVLYHQVHPFKLATDWSTGVMAALLFWQHRLALGLLVGLAPSVVVSAFLIQFADLDPWKRSKFRRYVAGHMNRGMYAVRLAGLAIFWLGSWARQIWPLPVGITVVLAGWLRGLWHQ
jgi:hypothetical protein